MDVGGVDEGVVGFGVGVGVGVVIGVGVGSVFFERLTFGKEFLESYKYKN